MSKKIIFYRTIIEVEILHQSGGPDPLGMDLGAIEAEMMQGEFSGVILKRKRMLLTGSQVAKALMRQGTDPEFFGLDKGGHSMLRKPYE